MADVLLPVVTGRISPVSIKFIAPLYTAKSGCASEIFMKFTAIVAAL
jgi:hypothetical protein